MTKRELKELLCQRARDDFYTFCCLMVPEFYTEERYYLESWCKLLQKMYEGNDRKSLDKTEIYTLSAPPRHGKSITNQLFCAWLIGKNKNIRIAVITYGQNLSIKFSRAVRDFMFSTSDSTDDNIIYRDIFPNIEIESKNIECWKVKGSSDQHTLKTCTPGTSITGFGFDIIIVDDMVKDAKEACNIKILNERYDYLMNTALSRLEKKNGINKIIVVMTRWSKYDIVGQLTDKYTGDVHNYCYRVYDEENDKMLCEDIYSKEQYFTALKSADAKIILANYQQILIDSQNKMYEPFQTFDDFDFDSLPKFAMIDIADRGSDYTCCLVFCVKNEYIYIKDVFYTQDNMMKTEKTLPKFLAKNDVSLIYYERNNGGDLYMKNIKNNLRDITKNNKCLFKPFVSSENKDVKIMSNASWCNFYIRFPKNWNSMFNEFYIALESYSTIAKENLHDDAADCISMIADKFNKVKKKKAKIYI